MYAKKSDNRYEFQFECESLETRSMLSGITFDQSTGIVKIDGSALADSAQVSQLNNTVTVSLSGYGARNFSVASISKIVFNGREGNDRFVNKTGIVVNAFGHDGNDTLIGGTANDLIRGGNGRDIAIGGSGNDSLFGDAQSDKLYGQIGKDLVYGKDGNDSMSGGGDDDLMLGGAGNDVAVGDSGEDSMYGETGNDNFNGGGGDDLIHGGNGDDTIGGSTGNDNLKGGMGDDLIRGHGGNDKIQCEDGSDSAFGGGGADLMLGGTGIDDLFGDSGNDFEDGGDGNDNIVGNLGADRLRGSAGNDDYSSDANDRLHDSSEDYSADGDFEVRGEISNLNETLQTFTIHGMTVNYAGARVEGDLANGAFFKVEGTYNEDGTVTAFEVETKSESEQSDDFEARGTVSDLDTDAETFSLNGIVIDYSDAEIKGNLVNGAQVKVEGTLNDGVVEAREIKLGEEDDDIGIPINFEGFGTISNLNTTAKTFEIFGITVSYALAELEGLLMNGAEVKVEGNLQDGILTADEVEVEDAGDDLGEVEVFGEISELNTTNKTFKILGLLVDYSQAEINETPENGLVIEIEGLFDSDTNMIVVDEIG